VTVEGGDLHRDGIVLSERVARDGEAAPDGANDFSARNGDAAEVLCALILRNKEDRAAIGGETRMAHTAIKGRSQDSCFSA
jgi:hypothetical protein